MWSFGLWLQPLWRKRWWSSLIYWLTVFQKESRALCSLLFYSRFFPNHSVLPHPCQAFISSTLALPYKGGLMCYVPRAGIPLIPQTGTLNSQCLPPPPLPQCSLFPVPSCLTIFFFFCFPAQLCIYIESIMSLFSCISLTPGVILLVLMWIKWFNTCNCMLWTHIWYILQIRS